ncbi:MAG: PAS domain S-box protein [Gammaproteobacteria bacterium]|nr:MAG: PAS domain S-box protein [Gammaproteobacteria bacterium]
MDLENKRLFTWMPWCITLLITGLFVVLLHNELTRQESEWQQRLLLEQAAVGSASNITQEDLLHHAEVFAELIAKDTVVTSLIHKAVIVHDMEGGSGGAEQSATLRKQLQQTLEHYWIQMVPLGFRELNIHFFSSAAEPKAVIFLRANKAERFGDDIIKISPLLSSALKTGNPVKGMEVRHYGANYRAIVPINLNDGSNRSVAAIEVGMSLLPAGDAEKSKGQAVLVSTPIARELLWGPSQEIPASSKNLGNPWYLESYNNPLIKDWLANGIFSNINMDKSVPWTVSHHEKTYLLAIVRLAGQTPSSASAAPTTMVVSWIDVSAELAAYLGARQTLITNYLAGWILSLAVLWFLLRLNRRHILQVLRDHSDLVKKERDLSEQSRQRLNLALVSSESGFWEWNIATNQAYFSKEWRAMCGLEGDEGTGDIEEWMARVHPSDKRASYNEMIRHIKGETPMFENEYRLRVADGDYKWIFTRGKVVEWLPDGKAALMLGVYTDITDRKKNEIIVVRQQAALRALNQIASVPFSSAEDQLRHALEIGARYFGLPCGVISRVQGKQYQIKIIVGQTCQRSAEGPLSNYFCEFTLREQDVFSSDEISKSEYANHYATDHMKVDSYIGVPIWLQGKMYGTLSFDSERSRHQPYDDLDKDFMRLLSRWVGITLERWQDQSEQQLLLDRFEKLCNQLPGFLYQYQLNADGRNFFPFASSGIEEIYGVSAEEVKEDATHVFNVVHPDDIGWVSESISASAASLKNWNVTFRIIHPRRGEIWVRGEARPEQLKGGDTLWHGYLQEVTEEKLAAIKLQEINALREAIFDAASVAIISTDTKRVIKTFNKGAERLLGYSAAEVIDKHTPTEFHLESEIKARAAALSREFGTDIPSGPEVFSAKSRQGDEDENEWTYVRKDGSHLPVIVTSSVLRSADGEITGYMGIARDISEIKRMDRMKSEFISTVSHELRTPLTAISGALGIVVNGAAGELPNTAIKMLNIAHKNSLRLIHLVNDLLDMEKLNAGKMYFDLKSQPIIPIISQSIDANSAYAAQYQVKFVLNSFVRDDLRVVVDFQRLQQVLANYLSNAAKFSPPDETVELRVEGIYNSVRVSVIDKGPGIPDEFRSRIFQKFSQADSSDSRQKGGTGLGLAICKEIIERMGGRVGFLSEVGKGSEFYFEIPFEESMSAPPPPPVTNGQRNATGERLLVIEDDPEVAELFATVLRAQNYRVDIAYSAQNALERLALYAYKALTMDIELPDMSGIELIRQLRSDASTKHIPIIVISANLDSERVANGRSTMFADVQWLQKPQPTAAIIAAIKKALNQ